jgi:hypothetical protein
MSKFFFTFGSDPGFPYQYGWVEVHAPDQGAAVDAFRARFPDRHPGLVNCAFYYTEAVFLASQTAGRHFPFERCHEVLFAPGVVSSGDPTWCTFERRGCRYAVNECGGFTCGAPSDDEMLCKP